MTLRQHLLRTWPWLIVYNVVVFGTYAVAPRVLGALGVPAKHQSELAAVFCFLALTVVWCVESVVNHHQDQARKQAQPGERNSV